jgi:uncharacterized membrane protein
MTATVPRRAVLPLLLVWLLIALYVLNFGTLSILKHAAFQTHTADLGNMDQPIWNTLHGHFLEETKDDGTQSPRLTDHVEPIFALVSLSYLANDGAEAILIVQTLAIALGALPVFWIARRRLKSAWAGVAFAVVYLLLPALQAANLTEFHAVPLAVAPLLFAFYFIEEERPGWAWLAALIALSVKEEITLLVLMLGLYALAFKRRKLNGALLVAVSLAWFAVATFVIVPHYAQSGQTVYVGRYESLGGGSFGGVLRSAATHPWTLLQMLDRDRILYLVGLLAGAGFLSLLNPVGLILSAPVLAANVFSDYPAMFSGEYHYSAPVMPFVIIAAIYGAGWLADRMARWGLDRQRAVLVVSAWALLWGFGYNTVAGFAPWSDKFEWPQVPAHNRLLARFAAQIPPDAVLSTTPSLFPHLDHRRVIYLYPVVKDAEYVLLDVSGTTDMHPNDVRSSFLDLTAGRFGIVDAVDGYVLLRRGFADSADLPDGFFDFARARDPRPQYALQVDFGPYLRLRGFDVIDQFRWRLTKVRFYWEVRQAPPADLRVYPFFLNDAGQVVEDTSQRPMVAPIWYPPSRWQPGEIIAAETLPWDLGDAFTVGVGVVRGDDWKNTAQRLSVKVVASDYLVRPFEQNSWVQLLRFARVGGGLRSGRLALATPPVQSAPARIDRTSGASLGGAGFSVTCLGADLRMERERLEVKLYWQPRGSIDKDYTVFVHLVAPDGRLVSQHDAMPQGGALPTSDWMPGETVPDAHVLKLDPSLPAGEYRVEAGMYSVQTMERLPVTDAAGRTAGDHIDLGTLTRKG